MWRVVFLTLIVLASARATVAAADLIGQASVVDGDTIEIHGERIRLLDIDAPESSQTCSRPDGTVWHCGQQAARALFDWIGQRTVTCASDHRDIHGQTLARCIVGGGAARGSRAYIFAFPNRLCVEPLDCEGQGEGQERQAK
jgi:endonuclease YncB( thermonuclease family)